MCSWCGAEFGPELELPELEDPDELAQVHEGICNPCRDRELVRDLELGRLVLELEPAPAAVLELKVERTPYMGGRLWQLSDPGRRRKLRAIVSAALRAISAQPGDAVRLRLERV